MSATETTTTNETNTTMTDPRKPGTAWWRPIVDGIDSRVTPPANKLVRTNAFADTVSVVTRLQVRLRRRVERQSTSLLHAFNLPTAVDVRKMRAHLAAVEARLRDMAERLEDQQAEAVRHTARTTRIANAASSSRATARTAGSAATAGKPRQS